MNFDSVSDPEYWKSLNPGLGVTVSKDERRVSGSSRALETLDPQWRPHLIDEGYLQLNGLVPDERVARLKRGITELRKHGWIPVFAFVYDEYWNFFQELRWLLQPILGDQYRMLPDFWAWYVDPAMKEAGWGPHRDKTINTLLTDGMPKSATVWVSLTDADPLNGCMYLIPAKHDLNYHNYSDTPKGVNFQAIRALAAPAGSVLLWNQRVFHWGALSSARAAGPRISMAFEFQRGDVPAYNQPLLEAATPPPFNLRLRLIGKQILQYAHMYKYSEELVGIARSMFALGEESKPSVPVPSQKIGRNEPCPCGSGKKYKHCHGAV